MRSRTFVVIAALAFIFALSVAGGAQTLTTDTIFLKGGYVATSDVLFDDEGVDDLNMTGVAAQGEYNLNFDNFWLGFGLEYQRLVTDKGSLVNSFLIPMVSAKLVATGGLYVGAGFSGKYLIYSEKTATAEWKKDIDLWVNAILGYYFPIAEGVFFDLEGRFGYNLTNNQFSEGDLAGGGTFTLDPKSAYDIVLYAGIGFRAAASDY